MRYHCTYQDSPTNQNEIFDVQNAKPRFGPNEAYTAAIAAASSTSTETSLDTPGSLMVTPIR
jgi:hypothetical protein